MRQDIVALEGVIGDISRAIRAVLHPWQVAQVMREFDKLQATRGKR